MKKKQRCLLKRFAALVAAFMMAFALSVPAFAASDTEADMPSAADFRNHHGSWFVWRVSSASGRPAYELLSSPLFFSDDGSLDVSRSSLSSFSFRSPSFFDLSIASSSSETDYYACAFPAPLRGFSGLWSDLPSFPVGLFNTFDSTCVLALYSSPDFLPSSYGVTLAPISSATTSFSATFSPDTFTSPFFPSLTCIPFASRSGTSSIRTSYVPVGLNTSPFRFSKSSTTALSMYTARFLSGPNTFSLYPDSYSCPSSELGVVCVSIPAPVSGGTINSASSFFPSVFKFVPSLLVPTSMLPDVKLGDWISDSPEDLQKALTNEFGIDSGTLKNSKDNLNSWNSTSSVDTDIANTSLSTINALFQNLGQFLAIVSLMVFGAVVLRMLLRKAVNG